MVEHAVVVVGAGPTGMMLAGELALADVDVVVVERRPDRELEGSRSGGLHARTMEVLDQRGIVERFVEAGQLHPVVGYGGTFLDISDFPSRHNNLLALWQRDFEPILAHWVEDELGVSVLRSREVTGLAQDEGGVDVEVTDDTRLRASWVVGCDGGRSRVRRLAGIDFPGWDAARSWMLAEVDLAEEPPFGFHHDEDGTHAIGRREDSPWIHVVITEPDTSREGQPSEQEVRDALTAVHGSDFGLRHVHWATRFTDVARQAATYRTGRVLVAGDAAHVHPPQGGQGLNTGVQDAVNLGWKLAQVVHGVSPDSLLDTYHDERHPVAARVLQNTLAQVALTSPGDRHEALRAAVGELLAMDEPRRHVAGMISGLDIRYDLGGDHELVGRRMPDLDIETADGSTTVYALLHDARPLLLGLGGRAASGLPDGPGRVRVVEVTYDGTLALPVVGEVETPDAVLVRPDGHVAWAGDRTDPALDEALSEWFGAGAG